MKKAPKVITLTACRLRELLSYDPETGVFTWNLRRGKAQKGQLAGCIGGKGYVVIGMDYTLHSCHRLAWLYMTGEWPQFEVDHINGVRADNRWVNLRDVSRQVNSQNQRQATAQNRSSGVLGVGFDARYKKPWRASICVEGKSKHLGHHASAEIAHHAYIEAKRVLHKGGTL